MLLYFQLSDRYQEFVTDPEREGFTAKLQETEDWLYEDGEDETKGVYIAKLEELKKVRTPIFLSVFVHFSLSCEKGAGWLFLKCMFNDVNDYSKVILLKSATRSTQRGDL
jgi:hypothetical protein